MSRVLNAFAIRCLSLIIFCGRVLQARALFHSYTDVSHQILVSLPRYVRVNTLKTNIEEVVEKFESDGWKLITEKVKILMKNLHICRLFKPDNLRMFQIEPRILIKLKYQTLLLSV